MKQITLNIEYLTRVSQIASNDNLSFATLISTVCYNSDIILLT